MSDDLKRLESKIDDLAERLRRVEEIVLSESEPAPARRTAREGVGEAASTPIEGIPVSTVLSLVGRSLVVLCGAFLLRWLTQSGILPQKLGSVIGMIYALVWIAMADSRAARNQRYSAVFHGITAVCIALPLLVEVTVKWHYLTPLLSALHLLAFIILGLAVAGRRNLHLLAWVITAPAAPLALLLAVRTQAVTPFLLSVLILGFVTLWLGYLRRWQFLATLMAGAANFSLALMVADRLIVGEHAPAAYRTDLWQVLMMLFGLIALYFGSYCFRVFKRKRTITALEIGQTLAAIIVGLGGAALVIHSESYSMLSLGIGCLVLSVACYTAAYGFLPRKDPNRRNFLFYTLLALAMVLLGCEMSFQHSVAAVLFAVIALIAGSLAKRIHSPILFLHGAVYAVAAILGAGLLSAVMHAFAGTAVDLRSWTNASLLTALVIVLLYPWFPRPLGRAIDTYLGRRSVDLFLFVTALSLGAILVTVFVQIVSAGPGSEAHRHLLACTRTAVLAGSATLLAVCSGRTRFENLAWLVYTILVLGAVKLVFEDIAAGGAATLFLSLGLYGCALILAPRFLRRSAGTKTEAA